MLQSDGSESDTTEGLNTPHTHHYHPDREHKHSSQLVTTCGYLRCAGCGTWIKCIVLLVSAYSVQKVQIFHSNSAKVLRLSRSNTEKILYCFLTKASGGGLSPLPYEWEVALAPGKNSVKYSFGTTPLSRYQRPALQQDS